MTTPADPDPPSEIQLELPFASKQPGEQGIRALFSDDGARAWISQLWSLHQGLLLELAHFYLRDWDRAQEVVQDTWVDFLKSLQRFEGRCSAKTWLVQILKRCIKKEQRRAIFSRAREALIGVVEAGRDEHYGGRAESRANESPEHAILAQERLEQILRAGRDLPKRQAEVWIMRDAYEWTSEEVSAALALSPANQRILLHRARQKLRVELKRYFGETQPARSGGTQSHDLQKS
ncbi:MAG TPA: sigma-70 family RNA polymerase sigma factor [Terriglobia bacterium]|nr:sigma-70 family RNA polymerase sigma factor [Terriglobia bacterium]